MKESDPEKKAGTADDGPPDVDLDVGDVELAPNSTPQLTEPRRTAPPPLPPSALSQPPSHAPSQAPPLHPSTPPMTSIAPEPPPRSKLLYGLVLVGFFVVCLTAGAVFVRMSSPKATPAAVAPSGSAAPASVGPSAQPKVITINPVDMNGNDPP